MNAAHIAVAVLLLTACAPTTSEIPAASTAAPEAGCAAFPNALRACAPASCGQPHMFVPSFTIEHRIAGMEDGACVYTQSMPGDMSMACQFSQAGREEMAAEMEGFQRTGEMSFSFSTADPTPDTAMTRECEIRDSEGQVIPWGTSQR